jgi:glutathione peroxidase
MFSKVDVNGADAHPLFVWLRGQARGALGTKIRWNFTKFLVDASGAPRARYGSTTEPRKLAPAIEELLPPMP